MSNFDINKFKGYSKEYVRKLAIFCTETVADDDISKYVKVRIVDNCITTVQEVSDFFYACTDAESGFDKDVASEIHAYALEKLDALKTMRIEVEL